MPGDDDDLGVHLTLAHPRQRRQSVHSRQPHVEDDHVEDAPAQPVETGLAAVDGVDVVLLVAQHAAQRAAHARFVVNDQNGRHAAKINTGSSIANRVPRGTLSLTSMLPPCSATMRRTIARPRPLPRCFVE